MKTKYDVVIIGGGIAGAMVAYKLAKNTNLSILILEAGADRTSERTEMSLAYAKAKVKSPGSPYKDNKENSIPFPDITKTGKNPDGTFKSDYFRYQNETSTEFKSTYLKIGGGSTWHWLGNVPRFLPNDFKLHSLYGKGFDWPITYDELEKFYGEAEDAIGVSGNHEEWDNMFGAKRSKPFPMPEIWPTYSDKILTEKLKGNVVVDGNSFDIVIRSTPQARNSQSYQGRPACAGNSSCVPICPIQAKYDATIHLNLAKETKRVEISYQSIVFKIEKDENNLISKVHFKDWKRNESFVEAKVFVLATHAIESAILLQTSDIANSSGKVGKFLMDHPQGYGVGLATEPLFPFRGPPTTSGIDVFRDGDFRKKHSAFRISIGNDGWGRFKGVDKLDDIIDKLTDPTGNFLIGNQLKEAVEKIGIKLFRFSYSTEMLPIETNCVVPSEESDPITGMPLPSINFNVDDANEYNKQAFEFASKALIAMFKKLGATDIQTISDVKEFSGAGHILGTTKMGNDKDSSVVNKDCRSHDHNNLFIVGAGVFPTCGTANPTLTVTALALRLAEKIKEDFDSSKYML